MALKITVAGAATAIALALGWFLLFPAHAQSDAHLIEHARAAAPSPEELKAVRVVKVADAIYGAEGRCDDLHGESGEYGCYQYLPSTWRAYSTEVHGAVLPQTEANEREVTEAMIAKWIDAGKSDRWIFLMWNQGNGDGWGPGTKDCYAGVNDKGVAYDSCDYAARALLLLKES